MQDISLEVERSGAAAGIQNVVAGPEAQAARSADHVILVSTNSGPRLEGSAVNDGKLELCLRFEIEILPEADLAICSAETWAFSLLDTCL